VNQRQLSPFYSYYSVLTPEICFQWSTYYILVQLHPFTTGVQWQYFFFFILKISFQIHTKYLLHKHLFRYLDKLELAIHFESSPFMRCLKVRIIFMPRQIKTNFKHLTPTRSYLDHCQVTLDSSSTQLCCRWQCFTQLSSLH